MLVYSKFFIRVAEFYFGEPLTPVRVDIVRDLQRSHPLEGACSTPFWTITLDLNRTESELLADMDRTTRYEVRRGTEKDRFSRQMHFTPSSEILHEFCRFYNDFAATKRLATANRMKLQALADASALSLSCAGQTEDCPMVWHAYIRTNNCARLLHSASLFRAKSDNNSRQIIGRANRFLHWSDMLAFRSAGMAVLDLGGWYEGTADQERLRINSFKKGLGGKVVLTYTTEKPISLKGRLALGCFRWIRRNRQ